MGNSIFYSSAKGVFVIFALSIIFELRIALAVDFKTYLERTRAEISYHKKIINKITLI